MHLFLIHTYWDNDFFLQRKDRNKMRGALTESMRFSFFTQTKNVMKLIYNKTVRSVKSG